MQRLFSVLFVLAALGLGACGNKSNDEPAANDPTVTTLDQSLKVWMAKPPWPLGDRQADRITEAGLPQLKAEANVVHFHSHLDVFDNGESVEVPANIGIDFVRQRISPLHTHQNSGIMHVEAADDTDVTLGQFVTEWGVRIEGDCIGDVCAPDPIALYVNGVKQTGVPTEFVIKPNLEIALVLGTPPEKIPSTYDCTKFPEDACDKIPQR